MLAVLMQNKYLLRELVTRDIYTRYIGSIVGIFWSILNPIVQLALYTIIFSAVLDQKFEETASTGRFALYLFCGLLPWMALQEAVTRSSRAFIENSNLIKKVRFPLEVLPFGIVVSAFIHQCIGTIIFVAVLVAGHSLNYQWFILALFLFGLQLVMMYGLSLIVACLNVFFRDIAQVLGVIFMLFFWITPIVYPKAKAPGSFRAILQINPLTHMVEAYRYVLLGNPEPSPVGLVYWAIFCIACLQLGKFILARTRTQLVDLI